MAFFHNNNGFSIKQNETVEDQLLREREERITLLAFGGGRHVVMTEVSTEDYREAQLQSNYYNRMSFELSQYSYHYARYELMPCKDMFCFRCGYGCKDPLCEMCYDRF